MSATVSAALLPRWFMIGGITVLAIHFLSPAFKAMPKADFEMVLPWVIREKIPVGLLGVLLAGLLAAFMSTFSATINAGGAYLVNDLYKRYFKKDASPRHYVGVSYVAQIAILVLGIFFGYQAASINQVTQWIVNGLYGGYTAPNILKWHWWRFNGYGFFWGMASGIGAALAVPKLFPDMSSLAGFAPIFVISMAGSVLGSLWTEPEPMDVLVRFYARTRPWGFWGPVRRAALAADPSFRANRDARRDVFNVVVGIAAQMTLVTIPLYLILRDWPGFWVSLLVLVVTSAILKKTWLDRLEADRPGAGEREAAA